MRETVIDAFIASFDATRDDDLALCLDRGVAYQRDMQAGRVPYDADYLKKVDAYDGSPIARAVNAGRVAMLTRHLPAGALLLDIGAGSGAFVRDACAAGFVARGYDVMPGSRERLLKARRYADGNPAWFDATTLWDVAEHMENPAHVLRRVPTDARLFVSIPIFADLRAIRASRHYRPGEHLYYFSADGFIAWIALHGFRLLERSAHEVDAGREGIGAFAFRRD